MLDRYDLAVVGGGAAGLVAAVSAARRGASVAVLERMPRPGKKILATGGGRCNLLNERLSPEDFTSTMPALVASVLERFGLEDIRAFFQGLGLEMTSDESGRVFPATNQASSVLRVLEIEIGRLGVAVLTGFDADALASGAKGFSVVSESGRKIEARAVILAGGGRAYPALGSNGGCYGLAERMGHKIVLPVPSAVPLVVRDPMCHLLQGQKVRVLATGLVGGRVTRSAEGELLFTQYGLSGTAVIDISEGLSVAVNREGRRDAAVLVDLVPFMPEERLSAECLRRLNAGWAAKDLTAGLLPDKFSLVAPQVLKEAGLRGETADPAKACRALASALKAKRFAVSGTRGWNEAEFTSGGVDAREVKPRTLGSQLRKGLYFAGEILDVQGGRGGYNLAWAWASGFVAGLGE
ncbi:MAG: aminoacetone oxidase family FAD-binding enzyme [Candidatus Aminicenantes bacterium]|nr:aminoacetone oxidase family FAD-binding enzyme [Candidatus Aminicenantes bacterium]